jgi:hypothetical protein
VSCCWAKVGHTGGKVESARPAVRMNGGRRLTGPLSLGWATQEWGRQNRLAGPGSASSWVSAHSQNKIENPFSFSKSFYNLQTNLNSIQIWISTTSTRKIKYKNTPPTRENYASAWNATIKYLFRYINFRILFLLEKIRVLQSYISMSVAHNNGGRT